MKPPKTILNVTTQVDGGIETHWLTWMQTVRIPEMKATGLFDNYRLYQLRLDGDEVAATYVAQFDFVGPDSVTRYFQDVRKDLERRHRDLWKEKALSFATTMEEISIG